MLSKSGSRSFGGGGGSGGRCPGAGRGPLARFPSIVGPVQAPESRQTAQIFAPHLVLRAQQHTTFMNLEAPRAAPPSSPASPRSHTAQGSMQATLTARLAPCGAARLQRKSLTGVRVLAPQQQVGSPILRRAGRLGPPRRWPGVGAKGRAPTAPAAPLQAIRAQRRFVVKAESTTEGTTVDGEKLIKDLQEKVGGGGQRRGGTRCCALLGLAGQPAHCGSSMPTGGQSGPASGPGWQRRPPAAPRLLPLPAAPFKRRVLPAGAALP